MNILSSDQDILEMKLKQMGAKVQSIHGVLSYVKFHVEDMVISYVYNVNWKNQYFLQRIYPYPLGAGEFPSYKDIVKYIREDVKQFENACQSKVFDKFVDVNNTLHKTIHNIEDLFLEYNVPIEKMEEIQQKLKDIEDIIDDTKECSEKLKAKEK